ncbi:MAG: hypothetical protein PW735_02585 [Acidobacteriaceae bacterium]|nr:hypothetical protein [Acidobacteriaceae bacterium]
MGSATISVDEFQALEAKVLQAVELIRKEREARASAESERDKVKAEAEDLRIELSLTQEQLATSEAEAGTLKEKLAAAAVVQTELEGMHREREAVKQRVEKMLAQMDELL